MSEIFVQVFVPSIQKIFDVKISKTLKIYELREILLELLATETDIEWLNKSKVILCDKDSGAIFNINLSIAELKMRNGSQLMLI